MAALLLAGWSQAVESQTVPAAESFTYADLVDLALTAPVVAHVRVEDADLLSERQAPNVPPGYRRFLIEASVAALIRGEGGLPPRITYLVDLPNDSTGRRARVPDGTEFLVMAARVPQRSGELRLTAPDAQLAYSPETAERLREILRQSMQGDIAPRITGIGRAFNVPGSLPGESETQFFLQTAAERPISISVLRRPGEQPRWSVALGEMIDAAAREPSRESLLWYRLACTLPPTLPRQALADSDPGEARAIEADYRFVRDRLGPCSRARRPR